MSDPPDLLTLRQDQTEWNLAGRMQGQMDSPLTPLGRRQARRTGAFPSGLRAPAVIVTHGITGRMLRGHALGLDPRAFGDTEGGQGVVCLLTGRTQVTLR